MRRSVAVVLALGLAASPAFAADGALVPGKPAGVQQANLAAPGLIVAGVVIVGIGVMVAVLSDSKNNSPTVAVTTSSTGTSP